MTSKTAMQLEKQVCSLKQGSRLEELGINVMPLLCYCRVSTSAEDGYDDILPTQWNLEGLPELATTWQAPAFNTSELGVMLRDCCSRITYNYGNGNNYLILESGLPNAFFYAQPTEAMARAELLIWLIENKKIFAEDCNKRLTSEELTISLT